MQGSMEPGRLWRCSGGVLLGVEVKSLRLFMEQMILPSTNII